MYSIENPPVSVLDAWSVATVVSWERERPYRSNLFLQPRRVSRPLRRENDKHEIVRTRNGGIWKYITRHNVLLRRDFRLGEGLSATKLFPSL